MTGPVILVLRDEGADPTVPLPTYATPGAAGADLRANLPAEQRPSGLTLAAGQRAVVPTGLRIEIPAGFEAQIRPRSGLALTHGITLPNTPATIDSDYRGPLGVALINLSDRAFVVQHGERIAQMIVAPVVRAEYRVVKALSASERGTGGFGSTGRL